MVRFGEAKTLAGFGNRRKCTGTKLVVPSLGVRTYSIIQVVVSDSSASASLRDPASFREEIQLSHASVGTHALCPKVSKLTINEYHLCEESGHISDALWRISNWYKDR
jgi:hypothetical protein